VPVIVASCLAGAPRHNAVTVVGHRLSRHRCWHVGL
jgi:hypothetical protein